MKPFGKKIRCEVCGKDFELEKQNVYRVREPYYPLAGLAAPVRTYDATDCPHCGCQKILTERYDRIIGENATEREEGEDNE